LTAVHPSSPGIESILAAACSVLGGLALGSAAANANRDPIILPRQITGTVGSNAARSMTKTAMSSAIAACASAADRRISRAA
jgi:hypothetical protein